MSAPMTASPYQAPAALMPQRGHSAGVPLWGAPRRRQPILPLVALSLLTLLIAAPAAMSGQGESSNPIVLLKSVADTTYTITGLMQTSLDTLWDINQNVAPLSQLQDNMG